MWRERGEGDREETWGEIGKTKDHLKDSMGA